jgi:malate dehydrogenase
MSKISVIGAGNVGATAVYYIAEKNLGDIVVVDVVKGMPQSKGLDFLQSAPLREYKARIYGTNSYDEIRGSDAVVLTAGVARKPGMDRMDLLRINAGVASEAGRAIAEHAPEAVVIVVTNPLDVIAAVALRATGFHRSKVVGMAGVLDTTRFCYFISEELGVWPGDVRAMVLGGHGDTMVPLTRFASVGGVPLTELLQGAVVERLVERTRNGGAEIVGLLKTGSAFYAPAASVAKMVEAVVTDQKTLIPAAAFLEGEYGFEGIFLGVPVVLGGGGVERIVELPLTKEEKEALARSAAAVQKGVRELDSLQG